MSFARCRLSSMTGYSDEKSTYSLVKLSEKNGFRLRCHVVSRRTHAEDLMPRTLSFFAIRRWKGFMYDVQENEADSVWLNEDVRSLVLLCSEND